MTNAFNVRHNHFLCALLDDQLWLWGPFLWHSRLPCPASRVPARVDLPWIGPEEEDPDAGGKLGKGEVLRVGQLRKSNRAAEPFNALPSRVEKLCAC